MMPHDSLPENPDCRENVFFSETGRVDFSPRHLVKDILAQAPGPDRTNREQRATTPSLSVGSHDKARRKSSDERMHPTRTAAVRISRSVNGARRSTATAWRRESRSPLGR